jgi:hypothetical protein
VIEPVGECHAVDEFEHERVRVPELLDAVHGGDIRVVERCQQAGFTLQARPPVRVEGEAFRSTFRATSRPRRVSRARYTSPMPPVPVSSSTS